MRDGTPPSTTGRPLPGGQRLLRLFLTVLLVLTVGGVPATAAPTFPAASAPAGNPLPARLEPCSCLPAALKAQVTAYNERLAAVPRRESQLTARETTVDRRVASYNQRSKAVLAKLRANDRKIDAHNARVAAYPNGAPPATADRLNARAAALNAEQRRLKSEVSAIAADGDRIKTDQAQLRRQREALDRDRAELRDQHRDLFQQMVAATVQAALAQAAVAQAGAAAVPQPPGGDAARPPSPGEGRDDGGDRAARLTEADALDGYERRHQVEVDRRPVTAYLSPDAVSRALDRGGTDPVLARDYAGLVRKPDGTYQALWFQPSGTGRTAAHRSFDDSVDGDRPATAIVDGRQVRITGVAQADVVALPRTARYQALLATAETLSRRASDIHAALDDPIAESRRTVAVVRASTPLGEVDVVAGSGAGLTPTQRAMIRSGEILADNLPDTDAEQNALLFINKMAWQPVAGGASRSVCVEICAVLIRASGGLVTGEVYDKEHGTKRRTFIWP
ncbi:hypothetical protein [Micromonospora fluostatini]|uniref:hypothetical protein n=1 Tax=Micromonospora sp. JCM 30529 TaxID=3421643 RepID=UPI003D16C916